MFCIIPVDGTVLRFSWQMAALWMGGLAFTAILTSLWFRAFWLCALFVTATSAWPPNYEAYLSLLTVAVFLTAAEGFSRIDPKKTMAAMRIAAFALLAWIILQEAGLLRTWFAPRNAGPFNPNTGGVFLALCLPAFMTGKWWWTVPVMAMGIVITATTTAMLAAVAGTIVYLWISERTAISTFFTEPTNRKIMVLLALVVVIVLAPVVWFAKVDSLESVIGCDRWVAWKHAAMSMQAEMYGRGLGSWESVFPLLTSGTPGLNTSGAVFMQAHNEYVQTAFELGIQTLALVVAFLLTAIGRIRKGAGVDLNLSPWKPCPLSAQIAAGLAILVVSCAGVFIFHVAPTALLGVAWLGMFEVRFKKEASNGA